MSNLRKMIFIGFLFATLTSFAQSVPTDIPITNPADLQTRKRAIVGSVKDQINNMLEVLPGTKSNKYQWLESVTQKRGEFLERTKIEAQAKLAGLSQQQKIEDFLMPKNVEEETDESATELSETHQIKIMKKNFIRTIYDIDGEDKKNHAFKPRFPWKTSLFPRTISFCGQKIRSSCDCTQWQYR